MSKKMWHNIFKTKTQKTQLKINRRHSRGFYEEYQQQSELLNDEKSSRFLNVIDNVNASESRNENENENRNENKNGNNGQINVFEQQPQQSSFNSAILNEAQQLHAQQTLQPQQHQHLSTFSRVRNTLFSRHSSKKRVTAYAKSSESNYAPTCTHTEKSIVSIDVKTIYIAVAAASEIVTYHLHVMLTGAIKLSN